MNGTHSVRGPGASRPDEAEHIVEDGVLLFEIDEGAAGTRHALDCSVENAPKVASRWAILYGQGLGRGQETGDWLKYSRKERRHKVPTEATVAGKVRVMAA